MTQTSPYRIPTAACILQERLKFSKNIIAFDINLGCSGFIYALRVATAFIESKQAKNGLIVCADTYTKLISKNNAQCRPIFSDAAAATLISVSKKNKIGPFELGTDGSVDVSKTVGDIESKIERFKSANFCNEYCASKC